MAHVHEGGKVITEVYSYSDCGSPLSYNIRVLIRLELFFSLPYVCCNHIVNSLLFLQLKKTFL